MNPLLRWGGSWRTATCPRDTVADKERRRERKIENERESRQGTGRERERQDKGSSEGGRARERALAAPIYAPVTEPSGAIKLAL